MTNQTAQRPNGPTLDEIRNWPATVSLEQAGPPLGMSRAAIYALAARGELPCQVITVGSKKRVITASLVKLLSGEQS